MERPSRSVKSSLSATEVCAIISACRASSVAKLQFRDLHIDFLFHVEQAPHSPSDAPLEQYKTQTNLEQKEVFARESSYSKADQLALMSIEDPLQYEKLLMAGELEDEFEPRRQETDDK